MVWIIIAVMVVITIAITLFDKFVLEDGALTIVSIIFTVIATVIIVIICCSTVVSYHTTVNEIQIVATANQELESDIVSAVETYMEYEGNTFENMKYENIDKSKMIAFAQTFPELKSSDLIKEQIKTYNENNALIRETKIRLNQTKNSLKYWFFINMK